MVNSMNALHAQFLMLMFAGWVNRCQQDVIVYLQAENRVLREQLGEKRLLFTDSQRRYLAIKAKRIGRKGLVTIGTIVTPDTLFRWYQQLVAKKYDGSNSRKASDNPGWGYTRICGALYNLGHAVGRNTVKRILVENGFDPAPVRNKGTSWKTFLKAPWGALAATDLFSVEVLTRAGLIRYLGLFIIDLQTRRVEVAGIVRQPDGRWMQQIARNLTDVDTGLLNRTRYLIHDRDPLFTEAFTMLLRSAGVQTVKLPARSPNMNAYAERFVRSIKSECLSQVIPLENRSRVHRALPC